MQKRIYYTDAQIEQLMLIGQKGFSRETFSNPTAKAEAIAAFKKVLGQSGISGSQVIFDYINSVNNGASGETDLFSDYIETKFLNHTGSKLHVEYALNVTQGTGIVRTINVYFNGTLCYSGNGFGQSDIAAIPQAVKIEARVIRVSNIRARVIVVVSGDTSSSVNTTTITTVILGTETSWNMKVTGNAINGGAVVQPNQIQAAFGYIETKPSAYIETKQNSYIETFVNENTDGYIET